jgi:hypothetical protein
MAELMLIPFDREEIARSHRASINGEPEAVRFFQTLWQDFRDKALACFLCDREFRDHHSRRSSATSPIRKRRSGPRSASAAAICRNS